ncbi:Uncharacterized protein family UPF0005 containing protein [Aphelenchoides avenae]|nr:Uncharacterized protein family UPF0005 containing protein [Aphelenchus avenae]
MQDHDDIGAQKRRNREGDTHNSSVGSALESSESSTRTLFARKAAFLGLIMLGVSTVMALITFFQLPVLSTLRHTFGLYSLMYVAFTAAYLTLVFFDGVRRKFSYNLACITALAILTLLISTFHKIEAIILALAITMFSCGSVTLFAMPTKYALRSMIGFVFVASMIVFGQMAVISVEFFEVTLLYLVYAGLAALFFTFF